MYKLIALYPPPQDPEHFRRYYEAVHIPLAATMPGLLSQRYALEPRDLTGPSPFFCVAELEFADQAAFEAAVASEIGRKTAADLANFATGGVQLIHYAPRSG